MKNAESDEVSYILGHSERELARLSAQARHLEPFTRQLFQAAGVLPGMRVLDVGSGAGDVAFLAAELVGGNGNVVGSDRMPAAIAMAQARGTSRGLCNVTFREGDPTEMRFDQPFDAVVGRFVLMHCTDAAAMLRKLAGHLRCGGLMVFIEPAWSYVRSLPAAPLYELCCRWIVEASRSAGVDMEMGVKLYAIFLAAGLPAPSMQFWRAIGGPAASSDWLGAVGDLVSTLQTEIMRLGLATETDIDSATLAHRLRAQAVSTDSVIMSPGLIGAWSHA
jgi:2-polyprenyl-3-methyl-5-hydroxy-6-metoxy-1,4-benzoquinol methylase